MKYLYLETETLNEILLYLETETLNEILLYLETETLNEILLYLETETLNMSGARDSVKIFANIFISFIGAGVLGLPYAFKKVKHGLSIVLNLVKGF